MKKLILFVFAVILILAFAGCSPEGAVDTPELGEIAELSEEQAREKLIGEHRDNIIHSWGEPDGFLSGFWGEIWLFDEESGKMVILYYDENGIVEEIKFSKKSE